MGSATGLSAAQLEGIRGVLDAHGVRFAVLFGSATERSDPADVDIAVEFEDWRPGDAGYSTAYLELYDELETELDVAIDLVDVHSADESLAAVILLEGVWIHGSKKRRDELAERFEDAYPSTADAHERVAAAAARLRESVTTSNDA